MVSSFQPFCSVMVQRRATKHPLARHLEGGYLDDDRNGFQHEEAADNAKHDLMLHPQRR